MNEELIKCLGYLSKYNLFIKDIWYSEEAQITPDGNILDFLRDLVKIEAQINIIVDCNLDKFFQIYTTLRMYYNTEVHAHDSFSDIRKLVVKLGSEKVKVK